MLAGEGSALPDDQRFYGDLEDYRSRPPCTSEALRP